MHSIGQARVNENKYGLPEHDFGNGIVATGQVIDKGGRSTLFYTLHGVTNVGIKVATTEVFKDKEDPSSQRNVVNGYIGYIPKELVQAATKAFESDYAHIQAGKPCVFQGYVIAEDGDHNTFRQIGNATARNAITVKYPTVTYPSGVKPTDQPIGATALRFQDGLEKYLDYATEKGSINEEERSNYAASGTANISISFTPSPYAPAVRGGNDPTHVYTTNSRIYSIVLNEFS